MSIMDESEVTERRKFFIAAMEGNTGFFQEARNKEIENCDEDYFLRQTSPHNNNILHIAIKYRQYDFIKKVIVEELLPRAVTDKLIYQQDRKGNNPLHAAAEEGHVEAFEVLFEYGKLTMKPLDWSVKNKDGNTPLHVALINCKVDAAEWLVKKQPEVAGLTDNEGNTPLHVAAKVGATSIFKLLLAEKEQWQHMWRMKNEEGNTPLHVAIINYNWTNIATLLLEQDPELARLTNNSKETPLHLAIIKYKFYDATFFEGNTDPNSEWNRMQLDLENAAENGDVCFLEEARKREIENDMYFLGQHSSGDNILHIALRLGENEFIEKITKMLPTSVTYKLIYQSNINGDTLFHVAAKFGSINIFKLLLQFDKLSKLLHVRNSSGNTLAEVGLCNGNDYFMIMQGSLPVNDELIKFLVRKDSSVACWHDEKGLTPLHRAVSLPVLPVDENYYTTVIRLMIECCPESAKEVDISGKTILHLLINRIPTYQEGRLLLQIPEIDCLKDVKDNQGNTPLDLAWKFNYKMARLLLDISISTSDPAHISQLNDNFEQMKNKRKRALLEQYGVIDGLSIQFIREKLSKFGINLLFSRDSKRRNVLHNLMRVERRAPIVLAEYLEFIFQLLNSYPKLACHTDINGDTPIHILMQNSKDTKIHPYCRNEINVTYTLFAESNLPHQLANQCLLAFEAAKDLDEEHANSREAKEKGYHFKYESPSLVQNMKGNTPFHEAAKAGLFLPVVMTIGTITSFGSTNKRKETPLHVLAGCSLVEWPEYVIMDAFYSNTEAASKQDQDGFTPILRAVQVGHIQTVKKLDDLNQEASEIADSNGRTLWHMLVNQPSSKTEEFVKDIGTKQHLINLLKIQDNEGKTPLHLALESRRFTHARLFLKCSYDVEYSPEYRVKWVKELLDIKDGDGVSSGDQFASIPDIPKDLEDALMGENPIEMIGYRSVYGIPTKEMKEYVNIMGVIAALLTTITFTAAFTVPGGAVQDDKDVKDKHAVGTPLLVNTVAFQAFMFFDVLTMCLSTMVFLLFLWILDTGSKVKSVILMDFSIFLLLISFYTTLVSFMLGVYATTIRVKPWIAIYTLVMCLSLMLLIQKNVIIKFLRPMGPVVTSIVSKYYGDLCYKLTEMCKKVKDNACKCFGYLGSLQLCKKVKDMVCYASNEPAVLHSPPRTK